MAAVRLPSTLPPLFPGLGRRLEIEATSVAEAIDRLEERWPGLRDRLCEEGPALRRHIHVYVDGERAALETALEADSRVDVIAASAAGSPNRGSGEGEPRHGYSSTVVTPPRSIVRHVTLLTLMPYVTLASNLSYGTLLSKLI